jgi:hypothetical protein
MNFKKTIGSLLLAATLVTTGFVGIKPVKAATGFVKPVILDRCLGGVKAINEGDKAGIISLQATDPSGLRPATNRVQYRLYVQNVSTKAWTELTAGYTNPVNLGVPSNVSLASLKAGDYKTVAWIRYESAASKTAAFDAEHAACYTGTLKVVASNLQKETDLVTAYETAVKDLSTQAKIDPANAAKKAIDLTGLDATNTAALSARIAAADKILAAANTKTGTVTISVATAAAMPSIKDVTITSSIANAVSFKLDGFDAVKLGSVSRTFAATNPIGLTLLAADGKTVVATGTIDLTQTTGTVTLAAAPVPADIKATATIATAAAMPSIKDITVTVTGVTGAKFQIEGFAMTASGSVSRTFAAPAIANITIFAADGTTVLKTGTIDTTTGTIILK